MCSCNKQMSNPFVGQIANPNASSGVFDDETKKLLVRATLTGGILAAAASAVYGGGNVTVSGVSVPAVVPLAISGAAGSIIADKTSEAISKALPNDVSQKLADVSNSLIGGLVCGAASAGVLTVGFKLPTDNLLPAAALGAGSFVGADYVIRTWLENATGHLIF